jgi:hypothetical protein
MNESARWIVAALIGLGVLAWIGYFIYSRVKARSDEWGRCRHCGASYRGQLTYCPRCGQVVSRWSSRR